VDTDTLSRNFKRLAFAAAMLAFVVIVLGAYVRLSDAGLGCPDWPGCYGKLIAPDEHHEIHEARQAFPGSEVDPGKAWKEMVHRYLAGTLGLLILALALLAIRNRRDHDQQLLIPVLLVLIVVFQAALGMWTVTLLLRPAVVTLHLIFGMVTLGLLWWTALRHSSLLRPTPQPRGHLRPWTTLGLGVLFAQIALGGWTSTNYVALHCPDFPTCQGQWLPPLELKEAFNILGSPGVNYEGGRLSGPAGVTVHVIHRIGALVTLLYLGAHALFTIARGNSRTVRSLGVILLALVLLQVTLGVTNVLLRLPLPIAVGHNASAALLVITLVALRHTLTPDRATARS
jgi:cytochrome c oxidase assembly protein subunit 15